MDFSNPYKLTDETYAKLIECAKKGLPLALISARARITSLTLRNWLDQGAKDAQAMDDNPDFPPTKCGRLYLDIQAAYADFAMNLMNGLEKSANDGNVRSADFLLKSAFPLIYGGVSAAQASSELGQPKEQPLLDIPDEQRNKVIEQYRKKAKELGK